MGYSGRCRLSVWHTRRAPPRSDCLKLSLLESGLRGLAADDPEWSVCTCSASGPSRSCRTTRRCLCSSSRSASRRPTRPPPWPPSRTPARLDGQAPVGLRAVLAASLRGLTWTSTRFRLIPSSRPTSAGVAANRPGLLRPDGGAAPRNVFPDATLEVYPERYYFDLTAPHRASAGRDGPTGTLVARRVVSPAHRGSRLTALS